MHHRRGEKSGPSPASAASRSQGTGRSQWPPVPLSPAALIAAAGAALGTVLIGRVAVGLLRGNAGNRESPAANDRLRSADGVSTSDSSPESSSSRRDKKKKDRRRDKSSKESALPSIVGWEDIAAIATRDERVLQIVGNARVGALLTAAGDNWPTGATAFKFQWCRLRPDTGKVELFTLESSRTPFYTVHTTDIGYKICVLVVPVLQTIDGGTVLGKAAYSLTDVVVPGEVLTPPAGRPPNPAVVRVPGSVIPRNRQGPAVHFSGGGAAAVPFGSPIQAAPEERGNAGRPAAGSSPVRFRIVRPPELPPIPESPRAPPAAGVGQQQGVVAFRGGSGSGTAPRPLGSSSLAGGDPVLGRAAPVARLVRAH